MSGRSITRTKRKRTKMEIDAELAASIRQLQERAMRTVVRSKLEAMLSVFSAFDVLEGLKSIEECLIEDRTH